VYSAEIAPDLLAKDTVVVDFKLDKNLPAGSSTSANWRSRHCRGHRKQVTEPAAETMDLRARQRSGAVNALLWFSPVLLLFLLYRDGLRCWFRR